MAMVVQAAEEDLKGGPLFWTGLSTLALSRVCAASLDPRRHLCLFVLSQRSRLTSIPPSLPRIAPPHPLTSCFPPLHQDPDLVRPTTVPCLRWSRR